MKKTVPHLQAACSQPRKLGKRDQKCASWVLIQASATASPLQSSRSVRPIARGYCVTIVRDSREGWPGFSQQAAGGSFHTTRIMVNLGDAGQQANKLISLGSPSRCCYPGADSGFVLLCLNGHGTSSAIAEASSPSHPLLLLNLRHGENLASLEMCSQFHYW